MAYLNGNNLLFGAIGNNGVMLDQLTNYTPITLVYGYAMTQTAYNILSEHIADKYYAIAEAFSTTESIYTVNELTQAEYDATETYDINTLYVIKENDDIVNAYVGDTALEKLYLGENVIYESSNYPDWYQDGWQDLLGPASWYYPWQVIVAAATTPSSGTIPNCTVMYGSFSDYYGFNNMAINITDLGDAIYFSRANDGKKRKWVTYDSSSGTWGSVSMENDSGFFTIGYVVQNIPVKAFIIFATPDYPGGYVTTLPYQEDL